MDPRLRLALTVAAVCGLAALLGSQIAEGAYAWPAITALLIVSGILVRLTGFSVDIILLGLLLVGYLVGNRGFAQLMPPGLPLLPAEIVLLVATTWCLIGCAFQRRLPFRKEMINWLVLAWLLVGTARVLFDVPKFGVMAIRDYAMNYYAIFFFLIQHAARDPGARRFLTGCLFLGLLLLVPMFMIVGAFPTFFLTQLTILRMPVIYFKGDIAVTFMAIGSLLFFHWAPRQHRVWAWPLSGWIFVYVISGDNRASLLGALVASLLLLLAGHWRYPLFQGMLAALGLAAVIALAAADNTWATNKLETLNDRFVSIVDISGTGNYKSQGAYFKGDNNRFRTVWWTNVARETWTTNPVFGLGFGTDLARGFVQEYYPDQVEEFNTRSPHNIVVTAFGRMGAVGAAVWLAFCCGLGLKTWRVLRQSADPVMWSLWCGACIIVCSATFGVVLEGPMGAVVFWSLLGLANAGTLQSKTNPAEPAPVEEAPAPPEPAALP